MVAAVPPASGAPPGPPIVPTYAWTRKVPHINVAPPAGIILCVVIGTTTVLLTVVITIAALPDGVLAQLLI
ncbi:hypothetical protein GCM10010448_27190 [Streptomyces glomeratus]|uniref:SpdD protein n=1 Tax=Streptomyces glomeratus TaxID=284452 RepID=A0ABP6LGS8_9ACTN